MAGAQVAAADHISNPSWSPANNVLAIVEFADVLADIGATNTSMALNIHVVSEGK
jgi:hypothetical protein